MPLEFEKQLPLINEIVALLERWQLQRPTVSILAIANALHRSTNEVIRVFQVLNIQPVAWERPSDYAVEAIVEAATRHEVSRRF